MKIMLARYSIVGIFFSAFILMVDLYLLKEKKIDGSTFTRWFIIGIVLGVVSFVPTFFTFLYMLIGTEVLVSAVTISSFMVLLTLIFYLDYRINRLNDMLMKLAALISVEKYHSSRAHKEEREDGKNLTRQG